MFLEKYFEPGLKIGFLNKALKGLVNGFWFLIILIPTGEYNISPG